MSILPEQLGARPHPRRPGPPIRTAADVAQAQAAKFYLAFRVSAAALLPLTLVDREADRPAAVAFLATELGLDAAIDAGIITGYEFVWSGSVYPQTPKEVRLFQPAGKAHWRKLLGDRLYENLNAFLKSMNDPLGHYFP